MWGGSYAGHAQWNTARKFPPHLKCIVPAAAPFIGHDFPLRGNIPFSYAVRWLTAVSGRTFQAAVFADAVFWHRAFCRWFEQGLAFRLLDRVVGSPARIFQQWLDHPCEQDEYWQRYNPTPEEYSRLDLPVLTITGIYDGDQLGALRHYRAQGERGRSYLIIGPWDHAGTRDPRAEFAGVKIGPAGVLDLRELHYQWYAWTLLDGVRPAFLQKRVAYYVMVAEEWRYSDTLESITARRMTLDLAPGSYTYDPRDLRLARLESEIDPEDRSDLRLLNAPEACQLVYHTEPLSEALDVCGFFSLVAWLSIDRPDTDFRACIYDIAPDGSGVLLTSDCLRARYREGHEQLVETREPLCYRFEQFPFVARRILPGHRLRLVFGPLNSIHYQKNYNSGGVVSEESMADARAVTVRLSGASVLSIPLGSAHPQRTQQTGDMQRLGK
jgi:predicted acyl esterase